MTFFNKHKDQSDNTYSRRLNQMMHLTLQSALDILQTPHNEPKQCDKSCVNIHIGFKSEHLEMEGLEGQMVWERDFEDAVSSVSAAS
jgi:hypothetical protein